MAVTDLKVLLAARELMIFDFDGTLADTTPLHVTAFAEVLGPFGALVDYPSIAGRKTRDALKERLDSVGMTLSDFELNELAVRKQRKVRELIRDTLQPLPGVLPFLIWARTRARLAVYSSGSRGTVAASLERLGLVGWFDPLLCAEDVVRGKPDPEGFMKALAITSVPANRAVVFEDSDAGIAAARGAGLEVINVRETPFTQLAASCP